MSHPYHHTKLQRLDSSEYQILGPSLEIFEFDWTQEEPGTLAKGRTTSALPLRFDCPGICNGLLIYFTLQMDAREGMASINGEDTEASAEYSSGFDNPHSHWDTPIRFLPVELHVRKGDELALTARHNLHDLDHLKISGIPPSMLGAVGHKEFLTNDVGKRLGVTLELADGERAVSATPHTTRSLERERDVE